MNLKIPWIISLVLLCASVACGQNPKAQVVPDLKGVRLGMSVMQVQAAAKTSSAPIAVGSGTTMIRVSTTVGGASSKAYYSFAKPRDPNGSAVLYRISADFSTSAASSVLEGLKQKYGAPTRLEDTTKTNRMGAKFEGFEAVWNLGKYRITLNSPGSKVDEASLAMYDIETATRLAEQSNKAKAKDL